MEGSKRIVIGAVLVIVIVVAAVIVVKRTMGTPPGPTALLERPIEKIDIKTLEVVTLPASEWNGKYMWDSSHPFHFKNPKTGEYSMVDAIKCASCGKLIPDPFALQGVRMGKVAPEERERILNEYICPRCGKKACAEVAPAPGVAH